MSRKGLSTKVLQWAPVWAVLLTGLAPLEAQTANPQKIVQEASWNELHASGEAHPFRYRLKRVDPKGSTVKEIIETKDGDVARLIEKNGQPLNAEDAADESKRLNTLLADPSLQEHRHKKEQEDSKRGDEMVRMLPDAFLYTDAGTVQGPVGPCYRLSFKPNPNFTPPDREGEVYHGMVGELWVDKAQKRLVKIDAHLVEDVNFGWGVIGRLYKGGSIVVEDSDVGNHHWETIHMKLNLHGKILMVKNEDFSTTEDSDRFQPVPSQIGYQDAIRLLMKEPGPQVADK